LRSEATPSWWPERQHSGEKSRMALRRKHRARVEYAKEREGEGSRAYAFLMNADLDSQVDFP
jgi:hypothetical protein